MPTEAQYRAVQRIDRSMRFSLWEREDSVIRFPKTAQEKAQKAAPMTTFLDEAKVELVVRPTKD